MVIDKNGVGYKRKALAHKECYPPLHSNRWIYRDSLVRMAQDKTESSRAAKERVGAANTEPITSGSSMSSTHCIHYLVEGQVPDCDNDEEVE